MTIASGHGLVLNGSLWFTSRNLTESDKMSFARLLT
jgi:hypothetical protein